MQNKPLNSFETLKSLVILETMELAPIQLEDLRDPHIRRVLYSYIERMLVRTTDPNSINSNEIMHLHQTINALETNIHIWNTGENEAGIPDAQPLDYDHPVFDGQFIVDPTLSVDSDVETVIDETNELSLENLRETELNSLYSIPLQRTYSIPRPEFQEVVSPISFTEYIQSIYNRREIIKFTVKRYPITKLLLKNDTKTACGICIETPGILHMAVAQCCLNTFCINCIKTWEQSCTNKRCNATCPLCRTVGPEIKIYCETNM